LRQKPDRALQQRFDDGHVIGKMAHQLFPGGMDVSPPSPRSMMKSVDVTRKLMAIGQEVIYEAAFEYQGIYCFVDLLVKEGSGYHAYEVKSSTKKRPIYDYDIGIQHYIIIKNNVNLVDFSLLRIKSRELRESLSMDDFLKDSYLQCAQDLLLEIEERIQSIQRTLANDRAPNIEMSEHCDIPYSCDFKHFCKRGGTIID